MDDSESKKSRKNLGERWKLFSMEGKGIEAAKFNRKDNIPDKSQ